MTHREGYMVRFHESDTAACNASGSDAVPVNTAEGGENTMLQLSHLNLMPMRMLQLLMLLKEKDTDEGMEVGACVLPRILCHSFCCS